MSFLPGGVPSISFLFPNIVPRGPTSPDASFNVGKDGLSFPKTPDVSAPATRGNAGIGDDDAHPSETHATKRMAAAAAAAATVMFFSSRPDHRFRRERIPENVYLFSLSLVQCAIISRVSRDGMSSPFRRVYPLLLLLLLLL
tara:strand:- start:209 stop:634 length:426 start_codon:yes stop_codon:yes gene_type:complete